MIFFNIIYCMLLILYILEVIFSLKWNMSCPWCWTQACLGLLVVYFFYFIMYTYNKIERYFYKYKMQIIKWNWTGLWSVCLKAKLLLHPSACQPCVWFYFLFPDLFKAATLCKIKRQILMFCQIAFHKQFFHGKIFLHVRFWGLRWLVQ